MKRLMLPLEAAIVLALYFVVQNLLYSLWGTSYMALGGTEEGLSAFRHDIAAIESGVILTVIYLFGMLVHGGSTPLNQYLGFGKLTSGQWLRPFLLGLLTGLALNLLMAVMPFPQSWQAQYTPVAQALWGGSLWATLLHALVAAPLLEELVFRGMVERALLRTMPPWSAILVQALLFSVFHFNMLQGIFTFPVGLLLGYIYAKSGSLWLSIIAHTGVNAAAIFLQLAVLMA